MKLLRNWLCVEQMWKSFRVSFQSHSALTSMPLPCLRSSWENHRVKRFTVQALMQGIWVQILARCFSLCSWASQWISLLSPKFVISEMTIPRRLNDLTMTKFLIKYMWHFPLLIEVFYQWTVIFLCSELTHENLKFMKIGMQRYVYFGTKKKSKFTHTADFQKVHRKYVLWSRLSITFKIFVSQNKHLSVSWISFKVTHLHILIVPSLMKWYSHCTWKCHESKNLSKSWLMGHTGLDLKGV